MTTTTPRIGTRGYAADRTALPNGQVAVGFYDGTEGIVTAVTRTTVTLRYSSGQTKTWPRASFRAYSNQAAAARTSHFS